MSPRVITILVLAGVAAIALAGYRFRPGAGKTDLHFETVAADRGAIVAKVTATGTLSALVTVQVGSQVSGRIQELLADFNSVVTKDQVLARIDPLLFQAALDQARASVAIAEGNLAKAQVQADDADRQFARLERLYAESIVTQSDRDTAETTTRANRALVKVAEGSLAQTRASLTQAEVNLGYTTIRSPVDGIVISRAVDVGQTVAASLQAPTIFTIAGDLKQMQVDTSVSEGDVGKLTQQTPVTFTVDAYPGEEFQGSVRQIRNNAQTVQNVVTYDAVIDVRNPELKLKPGMTANVTFIHARKDQALRVPNAALRFRPPAQFAEADKPADDKPAGDASTAEPKGAGVEGHHPGKGPRGTRGDRRTVWVLHDGRPLAVRIRTGITDGSSTEVVEGELHEGDPVITDSSGGSASAGSGAAPFRRVF